MSCVLYNDSSFAVVFCVQDTVSLRGELYFPNLQVDTMTVDFGCILNDTEVTRCIHMQNTSPMEVSYHWSFALNDQPVAVFSEPPDVMDSELVVEDLEDDGVDQSTTKMHRDVDAEMSPAVEVDIAVEGLSDSDSPKHVRASVKIPCLCVSAKYGGVRLCDYLSLSLYVCVLLSVSLSVSLSVCLVVCACASLPAEFFSHICIK